MFSFDPYPYFFTILAIILVVAWGTVRACMRASTEGRLRKHLQSRYLDQRKFPLTSPWGLDETMTDLFIFPPTYIEPLGKPGASTSSSRGTFENIFQQIRDSELKRIVCIGGAGSGKSTILKVLANKWASSKKIPLLRDVKCLFFLQLRRCDNCVSIGNMIVREYFELEHERLRNFSKSEQDECTDILHKFFMEKGKRCAFVFDGYDEWKYGTECDEQNDIAAILRGEKYPDCLVFVTTRHSRKGDFSKYRNTSQKYLAINLCPFEGEDCDNYINKYFENNVEQGRELKEMLKCQSPIRDMIANPFFCMVVCSVWKSEQSVDSLTTRTGLLTELNKMLVKKSSSSLKELLQGREMFRKILLKLGKAVCAGLSNSRAPTFHIGNDYESYGISQGDLEEACKVGLLCKYSTSPTSADYTFYHILARDHCASVYLTSKRNKHVLQEFLNKNVTTKDDVKKYESLLTFACGNSMRSLEIIITHILTEVWTSMVALGKLHAILLCFIAERKNKKVTFTKKNTDLINSCLKYGLQLQSVSVQVIYGLRKVPHLTAKIEKLRMRSFFLPSTATNNLFNCITGLKEIDMNWSRIPGDLSPIKSVRQIRIDCVQGINSYSRFLAIVPNAKIVVVGMNANSRNKVIEDVSHGIELAAQAAGSSPVAWKELTIDGSAAFGSVSLEAAVTLANALSTHLPCLVVLELCRVDMDEIALLTIVQECRGISKLQEIIIGLCGTVSDGDLDEYLLDEDCDLPGFKVTVYHSIGQEGKKVRTYNVAFDSFA